MYQYLMGDEDALGGLDLNQQLLSGTLSMLYRFPMERGTIRPYAVLGGGVYSFDVKGDDAGDVNAETEFGLAGGVGADLELTPRFALFLEGRFHNVFVEGDDFQLLPITLGGRVAIGTR
jgi:outer membrane protein W